MTGRIITATIVIFLGAVSAFLGLMFIIASGGIPRRLIAGALLGAAGSAGLVFGTRMFRSAMKATPGGIRKGILKIARLNNGEAAKDTILSALGRSTAVEAEIADLLRSGAAREDVSRGKPILVFPEFRTKVSVNRCPYCGNEYPARDAVDRCPSCGGNLRLAKREIPRDDGLFSMDEE